MYGTVFPSHLVKMLMVKRLSLEPAQCHDRKSVRTNKSGRAVNNSGATLLEEVRLRPQPLLADLMLSNVAITESKRSSFGSIAKHASQA